MEEFPRPMLLTPGTNPWSAESSVAGLPIPESIGTEMIGLLLATFPVATLEMLRYEERIVGGGAARPQGVPILLGPPTMEEPAG